jgi:uncharacterized protein
MPSAVMDFLKRNKPRINDHCGSVLISESSDLVSALISLLKRMDRTTLCIQGPPGAGKTYVAEHVIPALIEVGFRVGITSNSHKAINNLLERVILRCRRDKKPISAIKVDKNADEDIFTNPEITQVATSGKLRLTPDVMLVGGTVWTFAHDNCLEQFDYLFIDEAGQVSIANLVAMARCTKNIVLMGDQMQLGQPIQGTHPGESGKSILEYLLRDHAAIPNDLGVFLPQTYRLHPSICEFISQMVYDGRLKSAPPASKRKILPKAKSSMPYEAGIVYVPVVHEGNSYASEEEVEEVVRLSKDLIGSIYVDEHGKERKISLDDILFVAPYNFQVQKLRDALGEDAKVGSVDKFQGQEAPIVILSMCSSSAEFSRGIDFLFSKNRLNVALSRAKVLAIVVGHPDLATTYTTSIENMSLINLYCALILQSKLVK